MSGELWNASCVLFVLGAICAIAGIVLKYYGEKQEKFRGRAEARVVDIVTEPRTGASSLSEFRNRQAAVFEYYAGGKLIKVKDPSVTYPCPYQLHQKVKICYDPANPKNYCIAGRNWWRRAGTCLYVSGIVAALLGCTLFLIYASRQMLQG